MQLADKFVRDTSDYGPEIERYDDGDICVKWPVLERNGLNKTLAALSLLTGLDDEMFAFSSASKMVYLHMPREVAEHEVEDAK